MAPKPRKLKSLGGVSRDTHRKRGLGAQEGLQAQHRPSRSHRLTSLQDSTERRQRVEAGLRQGFLASWHELVRITKGTKLGE